MYRGKKILALIPARGGSKRLPDKNIKLLGKKSLLRWSIDSAIQSEIFEEVMVNTDSIKIGEEAKKAGASLPFYRKEELASDTASSLDVVLDTVEYYRENNRFFDIIVLLQPTSPLRTAADIKSSVDLFIDKKAASVLSVCELDHPLQWSNTLDSSLSLDNFIKPEYADIRSQDLEKSYRLNGAVYVWDTEEFIRQKDSVLRPSYAYIMPTENSVDIDNETDFLYAEALINKRGLS